jgi:ArsR family transcriptional regulator
MHYRVATPPHGGAAQILREILAMLKDEKQMQADKVRLAKACCSPQPIHALEGAPLPS